MTWLLSWQHAGTLTIVNNLYSPRPSVGKSEQTRYWASAITGDAAAMTKKPASEEAGSAQPIETVREDHEVKY